MKYISKDILLAIAGLGMLVFLLMSKWAVLVGLVVVLVIRIIVNIRNLRKPSTEIRGLLPYDKPILIKRGKMTFPLDIIEQNGKRTICKQCSACHGCR